MILRRLLLFHLRSITMKIYLFDPETGVYQGEDFADDLSMCQERGDLPAHATTIASPPCRRGELPFFAVTKKQWEMRTVHAAEAGGDGDSRAAAVLFGRQSRHEEE